MYNNDDLKSIKKFLKEKFNFEFSIKLRRDYTASRISCFEISSIFYIIFPTLYSKKREYEIGKCKEIINAHNSTYVLHMPIEINILCNVARNINYIDILYISYDKEKVIKKLKTINLLK